MYVIFCNDERTESGLAPKDNFEDCEALRIDVEGNPMRVVHEFDAENWEEAKETYEDLLEQEDICEGS